MTAYPRNPCRHCRGAIEFVPVLNLGWVHVSLARIDDEGPASPSRLCMTPEPMAYARSSTGVGYCPCGHAWLRHDVNEYRGDGSEACCVEGCAQLGCPSRVPATAPAR